MIAQRLEKLGLVLPPVFPPAGSNLLIDVFGERVRHTRSTVGLAELPFDIVVEIELTARIRPS